jgi:carbamoyl-phosphate synthase large subunit
MAEDRELFRQMLDKLELKQPQSATARNMEQALAAAEKIGLPVMIRPSFVLGGRAMMVAYEQKELEPFVQAAFNASPDHPVLIDRFLEHAIEVDVDLVCDGKDVYIGGVMEHVEEAGIHSGDSACSIPPYSLSKDMVDQIKAACTRMALELDVHGLMNTQLAVKDNEFYIIEVNPRASRTVPYVSKATNVPLANIATQIAMGKMLKELELVGFEPKLEWYAVKEAVFPFNRFAGVDPILGPEMKSTGEVMGIDKTFELAFWKAELAAGQVLPTEGTVFVSTKDRDKDWIADTAKELVELGFKLVATEGTAKVLKAAGLDVTVTHKLSDKSGKNVIDLMKVTGVQMLINTPSGPVSRVDEIKIRSEAILRGLPIVTTRSGAEATVRAIRYISQHDWNVKPIQEYHA